MMKCYKQMISFSALLVLCACGTQPPTNEQTAEAQPAKSVQMGSGTVNLTADMSCGDIDKNSDEISSLYVYFQPEIPDTMNEVCYILSHVNAIDYSDVNMTAEQARQAYIESLPKVTDFLTDNSGYLNRDTEIVEINGLPAYHYKAEYKNDSYIEGYTILSDKYDTMTVEYVHTGSSEEHQEEFHWILDHIETQEFEPSNTIATPTSNTSSADSSEKEYRQLAKRVYEWCQSRFEYYDERDGYDTGDKYDREVFEDAAAHFGKSYSEISTLYSDGGLYWLEDR